MNNIKETYLESKEDSSIDLARRSLRLIEPFEEKLNKDACMFLSQEIIETYKELNIKSFDYLVNINSQLNLYTSWCIQKGKKMFPDELQNCKRNHYEDIHSDDIHAIIGNQEAQRIITRERLLEMCKELPNASDSFILLCLFEGIRGRDYSEIREIKWSDFDKKTLHLIPGRIKELYDGVEIPEPRVITVSDDLINYANKARFESMYIPLIDTAEMTELSDDDFIVKRTQLAKNCNKQPKLTRRVVQMLDYVKEPDEDISAIDIRNSGKVYFVKEESKAKGIDTKSYVFGSEYNSLCKRFNDSIQRQTFWNKYSTVL